MPSKTSNTAPAFTLEQVSYLEKIFQENTSRNSTDADLRYNAGVRSVLEHIRRISGVEYVVQRKNPNL